MAEIPEKRDDLCNFLHTKLELRLSWKCRQRRRSITALPDPLLRQTEALGGVSPCLAWCRVGVAGTSAEYSLLLISAELRWVKPAVTTEGKRGSGLRERNVLLWFTFTGPGAQTIIPKLVAQLWEAAQSQGHRT